MLIYFLLIFLLIIEAILIFGVVRMKKQNKVYAVVAFIQLFFLSAFRASSIGNDTYKYLNLFQTINLSSDTNLLSNRYEIGYIMLNKIIYFFSQHNQALLITTSLVILLLFIRFIYKTSCNIWLSIYLFITLMFYYFTMNALRQALAMAIIVNGYEYLKNRKLFKYLLVVFIATLFHRVAIIFIFIYPISYFKFNFKNIFIVLIGGIVIFYKYDQVILWILQYFPQYTYYIDSQYFEANNVANIVYTIISILIILFGYSFKYHKHNIDILPLLINDNILPSSNKETNSIRIRNTKFFNLTDCNSSVNENHLLSFLVLFSAIFSFISIRASVIDRVYYYFAIFYIIYIPNVLNIVKDKKTKLLLTYIIMVFTFLYNLTIFIFRPEWNRVFPYKFFWNL
ncbi:MAG: hypothetical protein PWR14_515 [Thermosediminibacterales bacterium]|nr:hypothetical protein [Thermosediminibacterales bacterium]